MNTPDLGPDEQFALEQSDQFLGCVACRESHHDTSFCQKCGQCFFCLMRKGTREVRHTEMGTFVNCPCGSDILWD